MSSPAAALWENREKLTEAMPEIRAVRAALETATGGPRDFVRQQWLQVVSLVYDFKPDLIIELGRGYGNSTCAMSLAMKLLRPQPCRLVSICLSTSFMDVTRPHLEATLADKTLLSPLQILHGDITAHDFSEDVAKAERVFVFWDAHGYDLAIDLLARLFPRLTAKPHMAVVHDMADLAYFSRDYRLYENEALWKPTGSAPAKFILGDVGSQYEEGIALVDFLGRNGLPFRSAESSYFPELTPPQLEELKRRFGDDFSQYGFWYYFSLNEAEGRPLSFPLAPKRPAPEPAAAPAGAGGDAPRSGLLARLFGR